MTEERAIIQ